MSGLKIILGVTVIIAATTIVLLIMAIIPYLTVILICSILGFMLYLIIRDNPVNNRGPP